MLTLLKGGPDNKENEKNDGLIEAMAGHIQ